MRILRHFSVMKIRLLVLTLTIISVYMFLSYINLEVWLTKHKPANLLSIELPNVIVHIDLKGVPLKLSYLESLLPVLKNHGVNGLLMEYEDMFPYEGKLVNLSAEYCYKKGELKNFLSVATSLGFEIIPLIQTFGHLEYALKLTEFQHLREIPKYPDSICTSKLESRAFLRHMVEQVIQLHTAVAPLNYVHIGCDEVFHINQCLNCKQRNIQNKDLFLQHIKQLSEIVKSLSAVTRVLIWDDMLREIRPGEWSNIEPLTNVHPVYWDYGSSLQVTHHNLLKYHKKFPHIWLASAFKGADGRTATFPNLKKRFLNHFSWMNLVLGYTFGGENQIYNFKGIIVTGWSRYSHMDPPCELLPVSFPSLVLNLLVIQKFKSGINDEGHVDASVEDVFKKHIRLDLEKYFKCHFNIDNFVYKMCQFEGKELYYYLKEYKRAIHEVSTFIESEQNSIASVEYYSKLNNLNMNNILENRELLKVNFDELMQLEDKIFKEMAKYYHKAFIIEYINSKSYQIKGRIVNLLNNLDRYAQKRTWTRRHISNETLFYTVNYS